MSQLRICKRLREGEWKQREVHTSEVYFSVNLFQTMLLRFGVLMI